MQDLLVKGRGTDTGQSDEPTASISDDPLSLSQDPDIGYPSRTRTINPEVNSSSLDRSRAA
jgi:hypothetical protein